MEKGNLIKKLLEDIMTEGDVSLKSCKAALDKEFKDTTPPILKQGEIDVMVEAKKEFTYHFPTDTAGAMKIISGSSLYMIYFLKGIETLIPIFFSKNWKSTCRGEEYSEHAGKISRDY
jgi:hypothetical protein